MSEFIITFASTHDALKAEKELKKNFSGISLIPTPRKISSECGFVLSLSCDETELLNSIKNIRYAGVYKDRG